MRNVNKQINTQISCFSLMLNDISIVSSNFLGIERISRYWAGLPVLMYNQFRFHMLRPLVDTARLHQRSCSLYKFGYFRWGDATAGINFMRTRGIWNRKLYNKHFHTCKLFPLPTPTRHNIILRMCQYLAYAYMEIFPTNNYFLVLVHQVVPSIKKASLVSTRSARGGQ